MIREWFNMWFTAWAFRAHARHLERVRLGKISPCDHPKCSCHRTEVRTPEDAHAVRKYLLDVPRVRTPPAPVAPNRRQRRAGAKNEKKQKKIAVEKAKPPV